MNSLSITPILLIGAQKSGTSFLFRLLAADPTVARARLKEPKIFSKPIHDDTEFLSHFTLDPTHRFALDGSVSYMHVPGTAEQAALRVGTDLPVIAVLRDPAERAISGYLHEVKHGRELRPPEEAFDLPGHRLLSIVALEDAAIQRAWHRGDVQPHLAPEQRYRDPFFGFRYVANSCYRDQLSPWIMRFPRLRLLSFDDLTTRPVETVQRLRTVLGLAADVTVETTAMRNTTRLSRLVAFKENRILQYDHLRPSAFKVWRRQATLLKRLEREKPVLPAGLAKYLRDDFKAFKDAETDRWI